MKPVEKFRQKINEKCFQFTSLKLTKTINNSRRLLMTRITDVHKTNFNSDEKNSTTKRRSTPNKQRRNYQIIRSKDHSLTFYSYKFVAEA